MPKLKKKILIVDDETALALLYKGRLEAEGYEVTYCEDGEIALETAKTLLPDLILLDLMMPRLNGFDAIELFKTSLLQTGGTYIVILSALSQPEDIEKAKKLGADDYLVKADNSVTEVVERINSLLNAPTKDLTIDQAPPTQ